MKICKHCQTALEEELDICPTCGESLAETESIPEEEPAEETAEAAAEEIIAEEPAEAPVQESAPKKRTGLIVGLAMAAVLLVALILLAGKKQPAVETPAEEPAVETPVEAPAEEPAELEVLDEMMAAGLHTNAYGFASYSVHCKMGEDGVVSYFQMNEQGQLQPVDPADVDQKMDAVVATCGDMTLTNRMLPFYYYQQMYGVQNSMGQYLSLFLDSAKALDEQMDADGSMTWQQFLIEGSLSQFLQVAALNQTAAAEGMTLSEEERAYLEANSDFDAIAAANGMESGQVLMEAQFGPGVRVEDYVQFMEEVMLTNAYANQLFENMEVTDEETAAYYDANADMMVNSYRVEKVEKNVVNVRHILIQPAAAEDGTISDEAWAAAEAEAQKIYEEWMNGEATEESFAELAAAHTQDPGSQSTGGLYEEVYPGQMVTEFNDWCFADGRQVGDHGLVKTTYGYHIMFFSGEGDWVYWQRMAADLCRQEKVMARIQEIVEGYEATVDTAKVLLVDPTTPSVPAEEPTVEE